MKNICTIALLAIAFLLHACDSNYNAEAGKPQEDLTRETDFDAANITVSDNADIPPDQKEEEKQKKDQLSKQNQKINDTEKNSQDWDRRIIRTASIETEVQDLKTYTDQLRVAIRNLGGYVAQENFQSSPARLSSSLTMKIPVGLFEAAVNIVSEKTISVNGINIKSQDVGAEMVDIKSRLETRRALRNRYLQLMQGAKNMEDLLKVQSEANNLQEEIESGTARLNFLTHSSAMSTIHLSSYQVLDKNADKEKKDEPNKILNAFFTGWQFMNSLLIGLISIWPVLLLVSVVVLIYRKRKTA